MQLLNSGRETEMRLMLCIKMDGQGEAGTAIAHTAEKLGKCKGSRPAATATATGAAGITAITATPTASLGQEFAELGVLAVGALGAAATASSSTPAHYDLVAGAFGDLHAVHFHHAAPCATAAGAATATSASSHHKDLGTSTEGGYPGCTLKEGGRGGASLLLLYDHDARTTSASTTSAGRSCGPTTSAAAHAVPPGRTWVFSPWRAAGTTATGSALTTRAAGRVV